jgi:mono/diheme cytochrome c family protein
MNDFVLRQGLRLLVSTTALLAIGACGHHFEPPSEADHVAQAEALYSPALFDTVTWASDSERALEGNSVYASSCRRCHGMLGNGTTGYAAERGIDVPSLVEFEWTLTDDIESVRRYVFVGHEGGMPTWGVAGLSPREIDGASYYVLAQLRPEVLQQQQQ